MDERTASQGGGRHAGLGHTVRAVLWSFLGVRKRADYESDATRLNPVYVIIAGVAAAALLVVTLLLIARAVVG